MRLAPVHDEQGKLTHFIGISEDVTQQKEAETSRQEALDRLQKIASRIPGVVYQFRMRPDGHCCLPFTSDQTRELFRVNPEELIDDASKVFTVVHPSDYQPFIASIEASAREMTPWVHEFRTQYDDGSIRWLLGNSQPEREEDGSILWHGFITDISYQKNAERILKENSQHTQAILDNVVDGVITIDGQGIISTFNRAAQRIFGYTANEIIGENVSKLMPEPYRSKHDSYLKNYQNSGIKHTIGMDREVAGQRKDGAVFPMDLAVSEIQLDGKSLFIGLVRDISIRKQNESALLAAKNEAERANLAKSKFLSSVSHELRTPMNAVLGFSQLMEIDNTLPEEHKENVQEILKAGRHLMELIDEILDLAKIERGNIELSIETVILSDVVNDSITLVRQMADARGIQIACANCSDIVLRADYLRLKQGLLNLLSNAIKYNRINGQVQIDYERLNHNRIRIKVSDTGEGISQDLIGELFQPFNRLGAEGLNIHGTGIGLTITRQLIELMGGSVGVNTRYGIGSTFWIELPQDTKPIATLASTSLLTSEAVKNGAFNLLYVDDNVSELKQVVRLLSRYPHIHLMTAHTPKIGLDLASDMHFDLIMLEINMPVMDGFTFLNELRKRSLFAEIPVIAMTASSAQYDAERLNAAGFTDYLTKPIDRSHFFGILDTFWPLTDQNKEK